MTASPSRGPLFPPSTPQGRVGLPGDLGPTCQCASGSRALWSMCWSHSGGPAFPCAAQSHAGSAAGVRLWFLGSNFPCPHAENTVMSLGTWDLSLSSGIGMHQGHTRDSASPMPASCHSPEVQAAAARAPSRGRHPVHSGWLGTGLSVVSVSMAKKQPGRLCLAEAEALRKQNRPGSRRGGSTSAGKRVKVRSPEQPTASPDARLQACVCTSTSSPPCLLPGGPALGGSGGGCAQGSLQEALSCWLAGCRLGGDGWAGSGAWLCHQGLPAFLRGAHLPPSVLTLLPASCWVLGPLLSPSCGREGHCRGQGLRPCPCSSHVAPFMPPLWHGPCGGAQAPCVSSP